MGLATAPDVLLAGALPAVWRVPVTPAARARLLPLLRPDEAARAARFRRAADRDRFVVGRGALRLLLAGATGSEPGAVELTSDRDGRPALAGAATSLDFNLSHAGRLVVCALSRGPRVGVDVEWIRPLREQPLIERQVCAAHERAWLAGLPAQTRRAALFELWTAKEACLKALGCGLREEPSELLVALDPASSRLPETCTAALGEVRFDLRRLSGPRGYRLALATLSR